MLLLDLFRVARWELVGCVGRCIVLLFDLQCVFYVSMRVVLGDGVDLQPVVHICYLGGVG